MIFVKMLYWEHRSVVLVATIKQTVAVSNAIVVVTMIHKFVVSVQIVVCLFHVFVVRVMVTGDTTTFVVMFVLENLVPDVIPVFLWWIKEYHAIVLCVNQKIV